MYNSQGQLAKQTPRIEDAHLKPAGLFFGLPLKGQSKNKISNPMCLHAKLPPYN